MNRAGRASPSRSSPRSMAPVSGWRLRAPLACAWRIATDSSQDRASVFPRCRSASFPARVAASGCPGSSASRAALDIILAGKTERAAKAFKLGLVDELVPRRAFCGGTALAARADRLARQRRPAPTRRRAEPPRSTGNPLGRRLVYRQARKQVLKKTGGHYPAPLAALDAVQIGLEQGIEAGSPRRPSLRRARRRRRVAQPGARSSSPPPRSRRTTASAPGSALAAAGPPARRGGLGLHGRRASPAPRCSSRGRQSGSRTPTCPGWGRALKAADRYPRRAAHAAADHPARVRAASARCSRGSDD